MVGLVTVGVERNCRTYSVSKGLFQVSRLEYKPIQVIILVYATAQECS